jgi:hypothetical protein
MLRQIPYKSPLDRAGASKTRGNVTSSRDWIPRRFRLAATLALKIEHSSSVNWPSVQKCSPSSAARSARIPQLSLSI